MPFEHDLGPGRHRQVAAQRLRDLGARAAQQAGELVFGQAVRHRRDRAQRGGRVGAQRHGDGEGRAGMGDRVVAEIQRAAAVRQPAHDELVRPQQLLTVDTQVLALGVGAARDHQAPGQERRHVARPAGLDWQAGQVHVLAFPDYFLAGRTLDVLGAHVPQRRLQHRDFGQRVTQALGASGSRSEASSSPMSRKALTSSAPMPRATRAGVPNRLASTGICAGRPSCCAFSNSRAGPGRAARGRKSRSFPGAWRRARRCA